MRTNIVYILIALGISACGTDHNLRVNEEAVVQSGNAGDRVVCIRPPPEIMSSGLEAKLEASGNKLGNIAKAELSFGQKIDKIRETLPGVQSFEVLEYHFCRMYTNGVIDKSTYKDIVLKVLPSIGNSSVSVGSITPECSPDTLRSQLLRAGSDRPVIIKASARTMRQKSNVQDFDCISTLATVLIEVDQDNGHGLYYLGETSRAKAKQYPTKAYLFLEQMRSYFFRYLDNESNLALNERDGKAAACYEREKGYCAERTAWINHLMANDYYQQVQDTSDNEIKKSLLQRALKFVNSALEFGGFDQPKPSSALKSSIQAGLNSLSIPSSGILH